LIDINMWDLDLCLDYEVKQFAPFKYFARPASLPRLEASRTFTCFANLPVEIRLQIYDLCDAPTLFQLMRTCASIRTVVSKRFWNQQDIWYNCPDLSFFHDSGEHQIPLFCQSFASQITQVEINVEYLGAAFRDDYRVAKEEFWYDSESEKDDLAHEGRALTTINKARIFWGKIQTLFPAISRVVISGQPWVHEFQNRDPDDCEKNHDDVGLAVQQAPAHISVFIAIDRRNHRTKPRERGQKLWCVTRASLPPEWQLVQEYWTPKRVLLPPRQRSIEHPLGALLSIISTEHETDLERRGLHWLRLESYVRYPGAAGIQCPSLSCDVVFSERNAWSQHLHESYHGRLQSGYYDEDHLHCSEDTPLDVKAALAARHKRVLGRQRDAEKIQLQLVNEWKRMGAEERMAFEQTFRKQLREENLFNPGELDEKRCEWIDWMDEILDPDGNYCF
jgi:hypothetical protein